MNGFSPVHFLLIHVLLNIVKTVLVWMEIVHQNLRFLKPFLLIAALSVGTNTFFELRKVYHFMEWNIFLCFLQFLAFSW
jgi:hypothetical protein